MEKETLLTGLKNVLGEPTAEGYLGDTGVSIRTLDAYIEALLPTITSDEIANESFYASQAAVIKAMGGQMRNEQSKFIKSYKPSGNQPSHKPSVETPPENRGNDDLLKRIEALENEREQGRKQAFVNNLITEVQKKSDLLKVSNKNLWNDAVKMVEYKDGMSLEETIESAKKIYENKLKEYFGDGSIPYGGMGGNGNTTVSVEAAKSNREAFKKRMQAQGRLPKNE